MSRHVPLADVADALRVLEERRGHQRDVAERRAAEVGDHGAAGRAGGVDVGLDRRQVGFGDRPELLEVVLDVQLVVVEVLLADDRVEEVEPLGHAAARRGREVALGIDQGVAAWRRRWC